MSSSRSSATRSTSSSTTIDGLGTLRIGFSWRARFETLPLLGQAFRSHRPEVELLTEEILNSRLASALRDGTIDFAVSLCAELVGDLAHAPIRRERVVVLLSAAHPVASDEVVSLAGLERTSGRLETSLVSRIDDPSPTLAAFIEVARGVFETESVSS